MITMLLTVLLYCIMPFPGTPASASPEVIFKEPGYISTGSFHDQKESDLIVGNWLSENGDGKINIMKAKGKYYGHIYWIRRKNADGSPILDVKNPDAGKKQQKVAGLEILKNFTYVGDNLWNGGTIYDPLSGRTYSCRITSESASKIRIRGYIGISIFGRTTIWTRTQ